MSRRQCLELIVQNVVSRALLLTASGVTASACGGAATELTEPPTSTGGSENQGSGGMENNGPSLVNGGSPVCSDDKSLFESMNLDAQFEYLAISRGSSEFEMTAPTLHHEWGTCDAQCQAETADYTPPAEAFWTACGQLGCVSSAIVGWNSETGAEFIEDEQQIRSLLGKIDTLSEAVLWARMNGSSMACNSIGKRTDEGAFVVRSREVTNQCPWTTADITHSIKADGNIEQLSVENQETSGACAGRRPAGFTQQAQFQTGLGDQTVGEYLALLAQLEDAAVEAFARLAQELTEFGAPKDLIADALQAQQDEVRHTKTMSALSRAYGVEPNCAPIAATEPHSLYEFALENAVEGCVREAFGAVQAEHQARTAGDRRIANAMRTIASEEASHAELSWKIHEWVMKKISPNQQSRIRRAQRDAIAKLHRDVHRQEDPALLHLAGIPSAATSRILLDEMASELFTADRAA